MKISQIRRGSEFYEKYLEWSAEKYSTKLNKLIRDGLDTSVTNGTFCARYLIYDYKIRKEAITDKKTTSTYNML